MCNLSAWLIELARPLHAGCDAFLGKVLQLSRFMVNIEVNKWDGI